MKNNLSSHNLSVEDATKLALGRPLYGGYWQQAELHTENGASRTIMMMMMMMMTVVPGQTREWYVNLVSEDGISQLGTHDADAPAGVSLEFDDLVCGVDDFPVKLAPVLRVPFWFLAGRRTHVPQSCTGDVDAAPDRHARVAVLADYVAVYIYQHNTTYAQC